MARRQSNAGSSAPIYEDFQPTSEQKEEQEAHVLYIHLPGFSKEEIRVIYIDSTHTIRVQGERPLGTNKRSRFNRTFDVPQNCSVEKIHGKFKEGILTIIIPKQIIEPPKPAAAPKKEGTKITPNEKEPSSVPGPPPKEPSPSKVPSLVTAPPSKEPSPVAAPPPKVPPPKEPSSVVVPPPPPPPPKVPSSIAAHPSKPAAPAQLPQGETTRKEQETSPAFQTPQKSTIEPKDREQGDTSAKAPPKQSTEKKETSFMEKAKEMKNVAAATMKTALEKREDRHLIVNVGVAVLVIAAVGAYVTYKIRSAAKPKD